VAVLLDITILGTYNKQISAHHLSVANWRLSCSAEDASY